MIVQRRSYLDIIAAIIKACPRPSTQIMLEANIPHMQFRTYSDCLIEAGFLEISYQTRRLKIYKPTPIGLEFVARLEHALEMLNGHVKIEGIDGS